MTKINASRETAATRFARRVFNIAGIYGIVALLPQYFMEFRIGRNDPPPITHPEYFYGFIGVGVAWQFLFLVIARDPVRYRGAIAPAILEKITFGIACIILSLQGRLSAIVLGFSCVDLLLAVLFTASFLKLRTPVQ